MGFFKEEKISDDELQVKLKALCKTVLAKGFLGYKDEAEYKKLLEEIYRRKLEPCMTLK